MPPKQDLSGYQYNAMSSLVLNTDRSRLPRRDNEPTGEPETLVGRIDPKSMGSRAFKESVREDLDKKKKKAEKQREKDVVGERGREGRKRVDGLGGGRRYGDVLEATQDMEGLTYRPRTNETREVYELMLSAVHRSLGDQPNDMVRSAADMVLETLKDENLKDLDKKKEVEGLLGQVSTETFTQLVALGKKITDYGDEGGKGGEGEDGEGRGKTRGEELEEGADGVAVMFENDDEDEDEAEDDFEIRDEETDSDEDAVGDEVEGTTTGIDRDGAAENTGEAIVLGGDTSASKKEAKLTVHDIDAFWLLRLVSRFYADPVEAEQKTREAMDLLGSDSSLRDLENNLMDMLDYQNELALTLTKHRDIIVWGTKWARSDDDEKVNLGVAMREKGVGWIAKALTAGRGAAAARKGDDAMDVDKPSAAAASAAAKGPTKANLIPGSMVPAPRKAVDLAAMQFVQGSRTMTNKKVKLPDGSFKRSKKGYEEIHVPEIQKSTFDPSKELVPIASLPEWAREAFKGAQTLNRVQSKTYPVAFGTDEPMLLCAPTGAGKTNVAMLTVLNELAKHRKASTGEFDLDAFKIVYVAPMKALVQEMVGNFSTRLAYLGVKVGELTGDRQMTKEQISQTQIIVTTPEKWDVITRKSTDASYTNLVRLVIIDEIHLLHDERGPVLEALVARTIRRMEQTQEYVRLVGLSATLPNYADVAAFLRVDPKQGLFFFDASYRPCPLKQQFVGITEKKAIKRLQVMNEVCYEKVLEHAGTNQVIVFVHSRKETAKTAKFLQEMAMEKGELDRFIGSSGATREILAETVEGVKNPDLKAVLPFGIGIHHAGMERVDRTLVEELFADNHLQVLVSTATLAWGVNLPAHAVIIKGTQIYNPEKGRWVELSPQDVLQMLGRAGRPQYDTFGEGIIITNHSELQFHLSILTSQLPIESQLVSKLADNLNAEVVLGTIRNRDEAVQWLGFTYWYYRALSAPHLYGIAADDDDDDPELIQKRSDIVHTAAAILERSGLVRYERKSGTLQSTELGRIASHYYITAASMETYNKHLRPTMSLIELFRVFAASEEFKNVPIRPEEKMELSSLLERVPIPVKESVDDPSAKINVLLQAYISRLKLEGFALVADMVYVTQSAGRILRALFEICQKRGWARLTHEALDMCKMVEKHMWPSMTPLRQFPTCSADIIRRAERREFPWYRYFDLEPQELGELIGNPKLGRTVHKFVHQFPKLELQALVQPITRSLLRVDITITPDFQWDERVHGAAESFWIMVEDVDGELILFCDQFLLRQRYAQDEHYVSFYVPMIDPLPPNYFISIVSDRWLQSETRLPLSFKHLILPEKFPPPTPLLDLQSLPVSALHNKAFERIYSSSIANFNKIQTQVFQALYTTNDNVLVGAPTGSGKTICAEFALLRLWSQPEWARCVCIEPYQEVVDARVQEWRKKFEPLGKVIEPLTGELTRDVELTAMDGSKPGQKRIDVLVCTPIQWDLVSRRWRQRKNVQRTGLLIADEIHLIGSEVGPTYEVVVSRTRYVAAQTESKTRIVAFGASLANARDLGEWLGASTQTIFNFSPGARPLPMEVHLQSFNVPHFPSLMIQMAKPAYLAIVEYAGDRPTIAFVASRKQCRLTALDLLSYCLSDQDVSRFLNIEPEDLAPHLEHIQDTGLRETLKNGIGYYHEAMAPGDRRIVQRLYEAGAIQVVVASRETAWSIPMTAYMVIIMGVQYYEGKEHRYVDYPFVDVLQMMGRACRPTEDSSSRCVLMCQQVRKDFFKKFLNEGLPIESHLHLSLHDHFNAEIVAKTIENKQDAVDWCTWQWFYRRLVANPNYYNMQGTSHRHLSDHLSELVETTLSDLQNSNCVAIEDDMDTSALPLGIVAAYYNVNYVTADVFSMSLTEKTKLKGILEIVSAAQEFESVPLRHGEEDLLRKVYDRVPVKASEPNYLSPHFKTNILLQAHFSRLQLPADLASDQADILRKVLNLVSAAVDVLSSQEWINTTVAMEFSQMIVQAVWNHDSPLKQIPGFASEVVKRCKDANVAEVYDIMDLEDDQRNDLLRMDQRQLAQVARFCNAYPSVEVAYEIEDEESLTAGSPITLKVSLSKEPDDEDDPSSAPPVAGLPVVAPLFPLAKQESWWLVVEDPAAKKLLGLKKVTAATPLPTKIEFTVANPGKHELKLDLICDSYVGVDRELKLSLQVSEGESSDEDDSDEDMADAE